MEDRRRVLRNADRCGFRHGHGQRHHPRPRGRGRRRRGSVGRQEAMTSDRAEFIREIPLFAGLPEDAVAEIAGRAEETHVAAGDWLFREGEVGERLYVLRTGRLQVLREVDGEEIPIRNLSPGAVLGELAVLTDAPRSASVRARRDSGLLGLSSNAFFELLDDVEFARALTRVLANQLQASRAVTVENDPVPPVIAVVPLADGVPSAAFAGELARAMAIGGSVKGLTEEEASQAEGFGDVLDGWERAGDQVVLSVESPADSDWRSFCLRQADRVVAVANADTPNGPPPAPNGSDLALLGWPGSRPVLRGLMSALEPRAVYHVQDGDGRGASAGLVARRLSGNSSGIVLSGGGARGLAHLGVLDELHKAGMA